MRTGSTRREFLGSVATASVAVGLSGDAVGRSTGNTRSQRSIQTGDEWPEFGYDAPNTGHNPTATGPQEDVGGVWTADADGRLTSSPVLANGTLYVASQGGQLYAFDPSSGDQIDGWPVTFQSSLGATPAVADGTIYVGNDAGTVYALDASTGEEQWRFGVGGSVEGPLTVVEETVYACSTSGEVYAIDATDGTAARWSFTVDGPVRSGAAVAAPTGEGSPAKMVYFGSDEGGVYGVDAASGEEIWSFQTAGQVSSTPSVADGTLYVGSGVDDDPTAGALYAIDAATGVPVQEAFNARGVVVGSPAVTEDTVYVGSRNNSGEQLFAVDRDSFAQKWEFDTGRQISSSPAVVDDTVYVTSESNRAYGISTDGEELWSFQFDEQLFASPAVANGTVYVPSVDSTEESTLVALGEGGEITPEDLRSTSDAESTLGDDDENENEYAFLIVPAAVGTFFTVLAGIGYAVVKSGIPDRFAVDEPPVEKLYEDEEESIPTYDDRSQSEIWEAIVSDVIARAESSEKVAAQNVIATKYVDGDTLDSPVVAYEVESARSEPVRIRVHEQFVDTETAEDDLSEQPLNEGWSLADDRFVFEGTLGPGETIKTMVGRQDCPTAQVEELRTKPDIEIEPLETEESEESSPVKNENE